MRSKSYSLAPQSGQIAVVTILVMAVLLTAGLSLASRTTQDAFRSSQQIESTRVFNAAEAGIEQALSQDLETLVGAGSIDVQNLDQNLVEADVSVTQLDEIATTLEEGQTIRVLISETGLPNTTGAGLVLEWGGSDQCDQNPASLVISIYNIDPNATNPNFANSVRYYALAGQDCGRGDNFSPSSPNSDPNYAFRSSILLREGDTFAYVRPIYNGTPLRASANSNLTLPGQSFVVESVGNSRVGDQSRTVEVVRTVPAEPSIFQFGLFSGSDIVK